MKTNKQFHCFHCSQESSSKRIRELEEELTDSKSRLSTTNDELVKLQISSSGTSLNEEVVHLRESLDTERSTLSALRVTLDRETNEKDSALLRNAQVSQDYEMVKQENRCKDTENAELQNRLETLTESLENKREEIQEFLRKLQESSRRIEQLEEGQSKRESSEINEKTLRSAITDLEEQLNDKTKANFVSQEFLFYFSRLNLPNYF